MVDYQPTLFDIGPGNELVLDLACRMPTKKYPNGRTGTHAGYRAHQRANEVTCQPCRDYMAEYTRQRVSKDPEGMSAYRKQYYENNKEAELSRAKEYLRGWRKRNPEKQSGYLRKFKQNNREVVRAQIRKRRALRLSLPSEPYDMETVKEAHGTECYLCGTEVDTTVPHGLPASPQIDHVHPLSREGCPGDVLNNTAIVHAMCNASKGAKLVSELTLPFPPPAA